MLRKTLCGTGFMLALVLSTTAQEKTDGSDPKFKVESKEKLLAAAEFDGKLIKVDGEQKQLTVQVTYSELDPNKVQANQTYLAQQQLKISQTVNIQERLRQTQNFNLEMQRRQRDVYKQVQKNVDLQAADEIVVRQFLPPVEYDEKGKQRKLTEKEKREFKGSNPKLPGYNADFDNLKPDQIVRVTLVKKKGSAAPKAKDKSKDKDFLADEERAQVKMIVIVSDAGK
jgi:hypothetical protein